TTDAAPERLRRAETVLQHRTSRIVLVLEQSAQNAPRQEKQAQQEDKRHEDHQELRRVREFSSIAACLEALRENEMTIWATDLSPQAEPLVASNKPNELPARLAIVIGRETNGVSPEMLRAAHRRVYLPLFGFKVRGDLDEQEKQIIHEKWHPQLVSNPTQAAQAEPWTSSRVPIRPLDDLRREKHEAWVPKSVRRRERKMPEVRERLGKRKQPESEVPSDGSQPDKKE
ncbi:hypothetical protein PC112_g25250, partial [Phytophthora cactorum]